MTQPIGSGFGSPPSPRPCYDDPIGTAAKNLCRNARTVREGFLCDESTARFQRLPITVERLRHSYATIRKWRTFGAAFGMRRRRRSRGSSLLCLGGWHEPR
jgi:hypothetical protein